jgi:hypothetical protein
MPKKFYEIDSKFMSWGSLSRGCQQDLLDQKASAFVLVKFWNSSQGILKGEVSLYHWPPVWLVWNQLYDYWQFLFLFSKQTNPNQSNNCEGLSEKNTLAYCTNESLVESKFSINLILSLQGLNVKLKPFEVKLWLNLQIGFLK